MPGAQPIGGMPGAPQMQGNPTMPQMGGAAPPQQGPTPPMPGQPSQPMQQPPSSGVMPPPGGLPMSGPPSGVMPQQGGAPGAQPQQRVAGPPGIPQPQGQFDLKTAATAIAKANPGVKPEVLVHALAKAMPYLNAQAQNEVKQMMLEQREFLAGQRERGLDDRANLRSETQTNVANTRADTQRYGVDTRRDTTTRGQDIRQETDLTREAGRNRRAELSAETKKEINKLSRETRLELEEYRQSGRLRITQLSTDARKEIAQLSADSRREIEESRDVTKRRGQDLTSTDRRRGQDLTSTDRRRGQDILSEDRAKGLVSREATAGMRDDTTRRGQDISSEDRAKGLVSREGVAGMRDETTRRGQNFTADSRDAAERGRDERFTRSEDRRDASQAWRQDNAYQRLELQRRGLEERAASVKDKGEAQALAVEARALHNKTMEHLQTNSVLNTLKPAEKKAIGQQINSQYEDLIGRLRKGDGSGANPRAVSAQTITKPGAGAAPSIPPAAMDALKKAAPGSILKVGDKRYTLENGQLKEVP